MPNTNKKKLFKTLLTTKPGCGCGKSKLSDVVEPISKPRISFHKSKPCDSSPSSDDRNGGLSIEDEDCTSSTLSLNIDSSPRPSDQQFDPKCSKISSPRSKITNSIAVEKESDDPYEDFRNSMIQMITEKEIYSKNGLRELLNCYLDLNSPNFHGVIIKAFTDIWNEMASQRLISSEQP